ncbi:MAG: PEP-CTERM sorting domain-containing protein [Candidatus Omnitrophica bacterium]|nr:PEP-CTERM sorting domain-containing protein [Candidatus Omnitrophota bacterium]MCG2711134.1 PEP-CTERM sorting domain-containing protein [Candidatus Omnitrophota bacterium]
MKKLLVLIIIMVWGFIVPQSSFAVIIMADIANSTAGLGNFEGTLTYSAGSATNATLVISLKNTSSSGGYLTAFVLNNPFNSISGIPTWSFTNEDFNKLFVNAGIKGEPYGYFDIGASLGTNLHSNFADNGPPTKGIAAGVTETFTFNLAGSGLDGLTEQSFIDALSTGGSSYYGPQFFVARFRGIPVGEGSDKVPAKTNGEPVPEPATMLLLGPALMGLAATRKKIVSRDDR